MKKAPRIHDLAHEAGVSVATVDRVLNRRPGVREVTVQRVLSAARRLDFAILEDAPAERAAPLRVTVLLPAGTNRVIQMFGDAIDYSQNQFAAMGVRCRWEAIEGFNPHALADSLLKLRGKTDGVAFMAVEHPVVREAVNALASAGIPTVTLISDLSASERGAYVGLDNVAAGRLAGFLLARLTGAGKGKFARIAGSLTYRAHSEREFGFTCVMEELGLARNVIGVREGRDDAHTNAKLTRSLLEQHPDLLGIYNIGGGAEGVGQALREARHEQRVVFIGHGLTSDIRGLLIDGTMDAAIVLDPQSAVMSCVRILGQLREGVEGAGRVKPVGSVVIFKENLP